MKDICCVGHITKDKIITPRQTVYMAGGTSFYFSYALNHLPQHVSFQLVTKLGESEMQSADDMRAAGIDVLTFPSRHTVYFENKYGEDMNDRTQRVLERADPFTIDEMSNVEARVYHLGSLLSDDFSPEVVEYLSTKGRISIDAQGYLREVRGEKVYAIDWADKHRPTPGGTATCRMGRQGGVRHTGKRGQHHTRRRQVLRHSSLQAQGNRRRHGLRRHLLGRLSVVSCPGHGLRRVGTLCRCHVHTEAGAHRTVRPYHRRR